MKNEWDTKARVHINLSEILRSHKRDDKEKTFLSTTRQFNCVWVVGPWRPCWMYQQRLSNMAPVTSFDRIKLALDNAPGRPVVANAADVRGRAERLGAD